MVFIRPKILRDGLAAAIETDAKYNYMRDEQSKAAPPEVRGPAADSLHAGTACCRRFPRRCRRASDAAGTRSRHRAPSPSDKPPSGPRRHAARRRRTPPQ